MPRSNRPRRQGNPRRRGDSSSRRPASGGGSPSLDEGAYVDPSVRRETYAGHDWFVRPVTGVRATREYLCPGCSQGIRVGTPHVVTWPAEGVGGLGDRRHWHTGCWARRHARPPGSAFR